MNDEIGTTRNRKTPGDVEKSHNQERIADKDDEDMIDDGCIVDSEGVHDKRDEIISDNEDEDECLSKTTGIGTAGTGPTIPLIPTAATPGTVAPSIFLTAKGQGKARMEAALLQWIQEQTYGQIQAAYNARKEILIKTAKELKLPQRLVLAMFQEHENEEVYSDDGQEEEVRPRVKSNVGDTWNEVRQRQDSEDDSNKSKEIPKELDPLPSADAQDSFIKGYLSKLGLGVL